MMSSEFNPHLSVTASELDESVKSDIGRFFFRELRLSVLMFLFVGWFFGTGAAQLVVWIVSIQIWPPKILGAGLILGFIGAAGLMALEIPYIRKLRSDLAGAQCEIVRACPTAAIAVELSNNQSAVAFDCGSQTLVITTGWWQPRGRKRVTWTKPGTQKRFPSTDFSITRLPLTGRVVAVDVNGSKLKVVPEDPEVRIESLLQIERENDQECFILNKPLKELVQKIGP